MFRWKGPLVMLAVMAGSSGVVLGYDDDDLLCRPGWSPEVLHQQLWQQYHQQRAAEFEYQNAMIREHHLEQRGIERIQAARAIKREKEARKREQQIARRKADQVAKSTAAPR